MPFNVSLTELSIASNSLGIEGATVLAEGLPRSALESLNLDRNGLCCEGLTVRAAVSPADHCYLITAIWCHLLITAIWC